MRAGGTEAAIEIFRTLAVDLPENAAVQSNLAACYLARSERANGSPHDLVLTLGAAERAVQISPFLVPALFNLAEALTRLHLEGAATMAWNRYEALDGDSSWAERGQQAMAALHEPSAFDGWQVDGSRFAAAALDRNEGELRRLVERYPLFTRLLAEELLLPAWGRAVLSGNRADAERKLAALGRIGRAFEERLHDSMVADTVGTIERSDGARRMQVAGGVADFGAAMARYRQTEKGDPAEPLRRAAKTLGAAVCPLAFWARLYGAVPLLYRDSTAAATLLGELDESFDGSRYPILSGRVRWLRGTAAINLDQPERAIVHYRVAFERLTASEGPQSADFLHLLLAEAMGKVGERDQEWGERLAALAAVHRSGEPRAAFSTLYDSIESLLAEGRPWAALGFAQELQRVGLRWEIPSARAETALQRGRVFDAVGFSARAIEEFHRAGDSLDAMGFDEFRERIDMTLAMAEGRAMVASDPQAAIPWLTSALERQRRHSYLYQQAALLSVRAAAWGALGRLREEEADLQHAIETFEAQRFDIEDPGMRQSAFEAAQSAFDRMVALQAGGFGDPRQAFLYAERSRGRLLLDQLLGGRPRGEFSIAGLEEVMPADTALVEYAVLPDQLFIWTLAAGRLSFHVEPIAATSLAQLVAQLEIGIGAGRIRAQAPGPVAALYDHLIRPIASDLPPGARLAVVPDRFLARIPFAALFDAARRRFLVEDRITTVQPSASLFREIQRRAARKHESADSRLLAVGDPAFDGEVFGNLKRLPYAADEARQLFGLYGSGTLLTGPSATRDAFLRAAPGATLIHVASHALLDPRQPWSSSLLLRPDAPDGSGTLSASAVAGLDLGGTRLAVLSVCRGVAGGTAGRESVSGLAAGFLAAGVQTVVANQWNASDQPTRELMIDFHRRFREEGSAARALRAVQLAALYRGDPLATWAGFTAYGGD